MWGRSSEAKERKNVTLLGDFFPFSLSLSLSLSLTADIADGQQNFSRETLNFLNDFFGGNPVGYRPGTGTSRQRRLPSISEPENLESLQILALPSGPQNLVFTRDMRFKAEGESIAV